MLQPEELGAGMRSLAESNDPPTVPVDMIVRRARRRYRVRQTLLPTAAAACVIAVAATVGILSGATGTDEAQPALPPVDSANDPRVPQDGDTVRAAGTLQMREGEPPRLCADYAGGPPPPADVGCIGVDLAGIDLGAVSDSRTGLVGTWRSGTIEVQDQFTPPPAPGPEPPPQVPCPAPPGGWPTSRLIYDDDDAAGEEWKRYLQANPEYNGRFMQLVDTGGGSILVFLAQDEAERVRVAEEVSALVGADHVCAIISDINLDRQVLADEDVQRFFGPEGPVFEAVTFYSKDLTQQGVKVRSVTVTPELVAFEAERAGQVRLEPMVEVIDQPAASPTLSIDELVCATGQASHVTYTLQYPPEGGAESPEAAVADLIGRAGRFALADAPAEQHQAAPDSVDLRYEDRDPATGGQQASFGVQLYDSGWIAASYSACPEVESPS